MTDPFSIKPFSFPKDFLFGSATAGHQIEGNNKFSNNWAYELEKLKTNTDPNFELSGTACNSYEMFSEDTEILASLKHKMYRMSIEWSRIEPIEGEFKQEEVDHYIKVFEGLKEKGIKLCLSLTHGTCPAWFWKQEWYYKAENTAKFLKYIEYIVPKVAKYVDYWMIFNEVNGGTDPQYFDFKINTTIAHAKAYKIIKQYSNKPVSTALMFVQMFGKRQSDKFDLAVQNYYDVIHNEYFLHAIRTGELVLPHRDVVYDKDIKNSCDYWAINSYRRRIIDTRVKNFTSRAYNHELIRFYDDDSSMANAAFNPECMIHNLTRLNDKPVIISENGLATDNDNLRIIQIAEYLCAINQAMQMGVDVIGYLHWSLLDNYEWGSYKPRFGLVDVDRNNGFKRTIKQSGYFYRDIIENNGFNQDILRKYIKEIPRGELTNNSQGEKADGPSGGGVFFGGV